MDAFTKLGADSNAFTSFTNTSYLSTSDNVFECLDLLDELVTCFNVTEESVERERISFNKSAKCIQDDLILAFFKLLQIFYPKVFNFGYCFSDRRYSFKFEIILMNLHLSIAIFFSLGTV